MGKGCGLIYSPAVVIQQLVRDRDLTVVGAVEEKGGLSFPDLTIRQLMNGYRQGGRQKDT